MFVFMAVSLMGVKWMAEGNTMMMIWKIIVPFGTIILIMSQVFHSSDFTAGGGFMPYGIKGIPVAAPTTRAGRVPLNAAGLTIRGP